MVCYPAVDWSPDGSKIAYGVVDVEAAVFIIDSETGQYINSMPSSGTITSLAWNPLSNKLARGTLAISNIEILDLTTDYSIQLSGYDGIVRSLVWSKDGSYLIGGSTEGTIRIWDIRNVF